MRKMILFAFGFLVAGVILAAVSFEVLTSTNANATCWHVRNSSARECCTEPNC